MNTFERHIDPKKAMGIGIEEKVKEIKSEIKTHTIGAILLGIMLLIALITISIKQPNVSDILWLSVIFLTMISLAIIKCKEDYQKLKKIKKGL